MPIGTDRRSRYAAFITGLTCLVALAPGAVPSAAAGTSQTRYASPSGGGTDCTKMAPCDLVSAVANAPTGSVVIVEPGSYGTAQSPLTTTITGGVDGSTYRSITVEGQPGKPVPTIFEGANYGMILVNSTLQHLTLIHSGTVGGLELFNATASQITVNSAAAWACEIGNTTLSDSVCHDTGAKGVAVFTQVLGGASFNATVRNVTAIADGTGSIGVECQADTGSVCNMVVDNTIAVADYSSVHAYAYDTDAVSTITGTNDLVPQGAGSGGTGTATSEANLENSTNKDPVFVDIANGDYHERPSSPSVDAGSAQSTAGTIDLDGLPRNLGAAPDIGAYELPVAATVSNAHVKHRGKHSISVVATIDTQGLPAVATAVASHGGATFTSHHEAITGGRPDRLTLTVKHLKPHATYTVTLFVNDAAGITSQPVSGSH